MNMQLTKQKKLIKTVKKFTKELKSWSKEAKSALEKSRDKSTEQLIKELKVRAAELAIFKEAESKRLKFKLAKI